MLSLQRLRMLRELEARGTVGAVGESLAYTASAVSQQLRVLEREAGARLLEPAGRGVRLTEAGRVLARHAAVLLEDLEAAEAALAGAGAVGAGATIRVAGFQSALLLLVAPALADLAAARPELRLEVLELEVERALPELELGHVDVVIGDEYEGVPRPRHRGLTRETLLREDVRLALPAGHPLVGRRRVPIAALADAAWASTTAGTGHRAMHVRICRALGDFEPDIRHASDDFLTLQALVATGQACSVLPDLVFRFHQDAAVAARPLAEGRVEREVFAVTRRSRPPAVEAVLGALHAAAARATPAA